eukprot:GEMP01010454.1.p1 GENE.GEMP01010454.1~~GEMP01010454.1.p1  ORF type:complete len:811 (+),score=207.01 GEMP01010454.1:218-2650(+)
MTIHVVSRSALAAPKNTFKSTVHKRACTFLTEQPEEHTPQSGKIPQWVYKHEDPNYYHDLPIAPGIDWFRSLVRHEHIGALLASFQVNFPESFCFFDHERYWFRKRRKGGLKVFRDVEDKDYFAREVERWGDGEQIVCIKKLPHDSKTFSQTLDTYSFTNFFNSCVDSDAMFQQYIASKNGSSSASLCRIAWNSDYKMSGVYLVGDGPTVSSDSVQTRAFDLRSVPKEAQIVVREVARVTQQFSRIRMEQVVVDLIRDPEGVWWFIQVKAFTLHRHANVPKGISSIKKKHSLQWMCLEDENELLAKQRVENRAPNPVVMRLCPLCSCQFPRQEMVKKMTMKMMLELEHHLLKRNVGPFHVRRVSMEKLSQRYNVCSLCWALYLAERGLSMVEKKLCDAVCVQPAKTVPNLSGLLEQLPFPGRAVPRDHPQCQQPMDQLRLFDPSLKPDRGPDPAYACGPFRPKSGVALRRAAENDPGAPVFLTQMRFMLYLYAIKGIDAGEHKDMVLEVNCPLDGKTRKKILHSAVIEKMMVYYLFAEKVPKEVFKTQLKIKLTTKNMEVMGSFDLHGITEKGMIPASILLFDSATFKIVGNVCVSIGFVVDEPVRTAYVALKPRYDCYVPSLNYVSCHLLPEPWLSCSTRRRRTKHLVPESQQPVVHADRGLTLVTSASSPLFVPGRLVLSKDKYRRPQSASTVASTMPSRPSSRPTSAARPRPQSAPRSRLQTSRPTSAVDARNALPPRPTSAGNRRTAGNYVGLDHTTHFALQEEDEEHVEEEEEGDGVEDEFDLIQRQLKLLKEQLHAEQGFHANR